MHPFLRRNNWRVNNLALCGNFNLSNTEEVFNHIVADGQHPRRYADTYILLEQLGHRLDREVERVYDLCSQEGIKGTDLTNAIESRVEMANVLRQSSGLWDGGYVICGLTGSGEAFAIRDPWGIRTAFMYADDEVIVLASERPVIQTVMNISADSIKELQPGQALLINKSGNGGWSRSISLRRNVLALLNAYISAAAVMPISIVNANGWDTILFRPY